MNKKEINKVAFEVSGCGIRMGIAMGYDYDFWTGSKIVYENHV